MVTKTWNNTQNQMKDPMINTFSPSKLNFFLFDFYLHFYQTQDFTASPGISLWIIASSGTQLWMISVLTAFLYFYFCSLLSNNDCKGFLALLYGNCSSDNVKLNLRHNMYYWKTNFFQILYLLWHFWHHCYTFPVSFTH